MKFKLFQKKIYKKLGLKSLARIDYIITHENEVHLIEVNTNPGMTAQSLVPQQISAAGLNLTSVLTEILNIELE
jgi:D-alanine-D-alanine ligase